MSGSLFSEDAEIVGCELGSRYVVGEVIGKGGFAIVYRGRDDNLNLDVAIKVPRREIRSRSGFRQRFEEEKQRLTQLRQVNGIVSVTDAGIYEDIPYLILDYMPGRSLRTILNRDGKQSVEEVCRWLHSIAEALDSIHERDVVHLDVKPGNILYDREGQAMLSDFGIARVVELGGIQEGGTLPGSPNYMAPEAERGAISPQYDQYSLGVIVYQALTGQRPPRPSTDSPTLIPPDDLVTGLSPGCSDAVVRAMDSDPKKRFPSCKAFAEAVEGSATPVQRGGGGAVEELTFIPNVGSIDVGGEGDTDVWVIPPDRGHAGGQPPSVPRPTIVDPGLDPGDETQVLTGGPPSAKTKLSATSWAVIASVAVCVLILVVALLAKTDPDSTEEASSTLARRDGPAPPGASSVDSQPRAPREIPAPWPGPGSSPAGPSGSGPSAPEPVVPVAGLFLSGEGRTVSLTSPSQQGAALSGLSVLFEGTLGGGKPTDILFLGDVRIVVDRRSREFRHRITFPALGPQSIRLSIEHRGEIVLEEVIRLDLR